MIRAAVYAWNRGALVVVDDAATPPTIVDTLDFEAESADLGLLAATLVSNDVERVMFTAAEASPGRLFPGPAVALALQFGTACGASGLAVSVVSESERKAHEKSAAKMVEGTASLTVARALSLVLADMAAPAAAPSHLSPETIAASHDFCEATGLTPLFTAPLSPPVPAPVPPPVPVFSAPIAPPTGKRRMGIDPGSSRLGIVVTAGDVAPLLVVYRETLEVGAEVAYSRPVKRKRKHKDGTETEHVSTHHRVLPPEAPGQLADRVLAIAKEHCVTEASIERVTYVFGMSPATATGLLRAAEVGAVVSDRLSHAGVKVVRAHVSTARARIVGKANVGDAAVHAALSSRLSNPTALVGPDEQDAALLCLHAAEPPPVVRARVPRPPREPSTGPRKRDRSSHRDRYREPARVQARVDDRKRIAAEREAAGCTCRIGGRHRRACPLFVAKVA